MTLFDEIMDFERVKKFIRRYPTKAPSAVAKEFLKVAYSYQVQPDVDVILDRMGESCEEHEEMIDRYPEDAAYVAEYYQVWAGLPESVKKGLHAIRRGDE